MIYLFTHSFPFSKNGEVFLNVEMDVAIKEDIAKDITIVPLIKESGLVKNVLREGIKTEKCLIGSYKIRDIWMWIRILFLFSFWRMPRDFNHKIPIKDCIKQGIKYFYASWNIACWIRRNRLNFKEGDILYSYWCNYTILGMAIARKKKWLPEYVKCVSRAHRYDVYENKDQVYFPYREFSLSVLDRVYVCSKDGADFLSEKYEWLRSKIEVAYLGVLPFCDKVEGISFSSAEPKEEYRIASCSYVSAVKRLDLLMDNLAFFSTIIDRKKLVWHHYGGGELLEKLKLRERELKSYYPKFTIVWHGNTDNTKLKQEYRDNYYHFFANVSESEGLPVSLMEAISAGIPVLATDVGGSREIVSEQSGALLKTDFSKEEFVEAAMGILKKGENLRKTANLFFNKNFSAYSNYKSFYNKLKS